MGEKKKNNISNIFYGVIGVATLMLAIIGATFAYFTATASNNVITGNMATIDFDLQVAKVTSADDDNGGMIPMSNNMMEQAVKNASGKGVCVDDNGNGVCQIYKITVANESTASMFLDGYVTLTGGSGVPEDYVLDNPTTQGTNERQWKYSASGAETTMRWAQVFCSAETNGKVSNCTTAGSTTARTDSVVSIAKLGGTDVANSGLNTGEIKDAIGDVTTTTNINGNPYRVINKNYIRVSDHLATDTTYNRTEDITSALVFNQYLEANDNDATNNTGNSSTATFTDAQVLYIVIWLSENGHNQTAGSTGTGVNATAFYQGKVTFISAQGSEVTATFADHVRVTPDTATGA